MQPQSKVTQYLASTLLIGLILPVSLMAQFQSAFAGGKIKNAKETRTEAKLDFNSAKEAVKQARKTYNMCESDDCRAAARISLNDAIQEKAIARVELDSARIDVQQARLDRQLANGSLSQEDYDRATAELNEAGNRLSDLADDMREVDLTTEGGVEEIRTLRDDAVEFHNNDVRNAVVRAKTLSSVAAVDGIVAIVGEEVSRSACGGEIDAFNAAAGLALGGKGGPPVNVSDSFEAVLTCVRGAALEIDDTTPSPTTPITTTPPATTTTTTPVAGEQPSCKNGNLTGNSQGYMCRCGSGTTPVLVAGSDNTWECRPTEASCGGGSIIGSSQGLTCLCDQANFKPSKTGFNTWQCSLSSSATTTTAIPASSATTTAIPDISEGGFCRGENGAVLGTCESGTTCTPASGNYICKEDIREGGICRGSDGSYLGACEAGTTCRPTSGRNSVCQQ